LVKTRFGIDRLYVKFLSLQGITEKTNSAFTLPGGSLPTWISNKANSSTIPDVFEALKKMRSRKNLIIWG